MVDPLVTPQQLRDEREDGVEPLVLDVRSAEEYAAGHVPGAIHVPVDELPARLAEVPPDRPIVTC